MTEARHQKREAQRDESTLKCVLAIILAVVALFASRIVRPLALALGLDTLMCSMVARAALSVTFIIILGGASWLTFSPKKVRDTWKYCRPAHCGAGLVPCLWCRACHL